MRQHHNDEEREASRILDLVRAGGDDVPGTAITWALMVLGDAIGLREFYDHL